MVKRFTAKSSDGNVTNYTGTAESAVEFYTGKGTPEPNAAELLREGKPVNVNNGVTLITIEEEHKQCVKQS